MAVAATGKGGGLLNAEPAPRHAHRFPHWPNAGGDEVGDVFRGQVGIVLPLEQEATDGQDASSTHTSPGGSPMIGQIAARAIVFIPELGRMLVRGAALASLALLAWLGRRRRKP